MTLPALGGQTVPFINVKVILDNVKIKILYKNANGLLPYTTHLVPILSPAVVPKPLTFLAAEHNLNIGTDKLFVPPTIGFGRVTLTGLPATSAHNAAITQPQPVVNASGANGGGADAPAHAAAAFAPPTAATSLSSSSTSASALTASAFRGGYAANRSASTRQVAVRGGKRLLHDE